MGNITAQGEIDFNWSQDNRLLDVSSQAQSVGQYGYDGRGLRVKRTVDGATLYTLYDASGNLLAEVDSSGNVLREYAYLGSQKLTMFDYTIEQGFTVNIATSSGTLVEGVNIYAFNENNSYTGLSRTSDEQGRGLFDREDFGEGEYTFRVDYLGSQFWSAPVAVLTSNSIDVVIEEEVASLTVTMDGVVQAGVKVYVFSTSGSYLGLYAITDENGQVHFTLPESVEYIFRADLLGGQYWSSALLLADGGSSSTITTGGGTLSFTVSDNDTPLEGIQTYLFTPTGAYLGLSATTDSLGQVSYQVPDGTFSIRADYLGYQFWSEETVVTGATDVDLNISPTRM